MKTFLTLCAAAALAMPGAATAQDTRDPYGNNPGADELVHECRIFADEVIGLKRVRGLCNVYYRAEDPVGFCISVRDMGVLEEFGWRNQYECMEALGGPSS
ncbi:hypothetical protein [Sphingomicrobium flavum]|uniref:hypothetical protein n=1 Tax=Sphingomicrobium flavum TaxID=1229164 RepID=UPI0021AE13AF|nr:hypothetical protein [Sphingomicrobium flavum]